MGRVADTSGQLLPGLSDASGAIGILPQPQTKGAKNVATTTSSSGNTGSTGAGATNTGGGSSGGFSAGGQFGATVNPVPDINTFLSGDPTYQQQLAALNRALADYRAQMQQSENQYNVDYAGHVHDLGVQRQQGSTDLGNDYASRGLYESGLQVQALGDLLDQFARRQADLDTAKSNFMANTARDYSNFQQEQNLSSQKAKQDALDRRAAQFGV